MKKTQRNEIPQQVSESVRRLNPHLYPNGGVLRQVEVQVPKQAAQKALDGNRPKHKRRKGRQPICVTLVASRRTILDDDNNVGALKPLRDAIARSLMLDDGDARIRWEYGQCESKGTEGVMVRIEFTP